MINVMSWKNGISFLGLVSYVLHVRMWIFRSWIIRRKRQEFSPLIWIWIFCLLVWWKHIPAWFLWSPRIVNVPFVASKVFLLYCIVQHTRSFRLQNLKHVNWLMFPSLVSTVIWRKSSRHLITPAMVSEFCKILNGIRRSYTEITRHIQEEGIFFFHPE